MTVPWIILDRDGVINEDSDDYIKSADEWQPISGSIEAIARLKKAGFQVAVATNQSGLARGLFDLDDLEAMHAKLQTLLAEHDTHIDAICYCPHTPEDNCHCRKPRSGMLDALEQEFAMSLKGCWYVGDHLKDLQLAVNKNCRPALVLSGKGKQTREELAQHHELRHTVVFPKLADFVDKLVEGRLT